MSPQGRHVVLTDDFFSLTSEMKEHLVKGVGRVTIFVPEEVDRSAFFRIHFEMPFDEIHDLSAYSTEDGVQIDRLVDLARFALDRIATHTPSALRDRGVEIVVQSLSERAIIPYWKIGSDIAISCLTTRDGNIPFFNEFRIWDPLSGNWLTLTGMDSLQPIEELYRLSQNLSDGDAKDEIIQKAQYLVAQGLVVEQEQWLLTAKLYEMSSNADVRNKGLQIAHLAFGL